MDLPQVNIPYPTQTSLPDVLRGYTDQARSALELQKSRATFDADVAQRQAESAKQVGTVQPHIRQATAQAGSAEQQLSQEQLKTYRAHAASSAQQLQELVQKPDLTRADVLDGLMTSMKATNAPSKAIAMAMQGIPDNDDPTALKAYLTNAIVRNQDISKQLDVRYPEPAMLNTGAEIQPVARGNPQLTGVAPGTPQGVSTAMTVSPAQRETIETDAQGNRYIAQRAPSGTISNTRDVPGATTGAATRATGPVNMPANETPETVAVLQKERGDAMAAQRDVAPQRDVNQNVMKLLDANVPTGKLGEYWAKLSSATGQQFSGSDTENYNTLGKLLAISNQQLAQSMGPHTNAGLAQQEAAGGTTQYDRNTLKNIVVRREALLTGTQLYQQGLEKAIAQGGIGAKRQFDQAWGGAMDVDALRFKNAVDMKNSGGGSGQLDMLYKQNGGQGSPKMLELREKLRKMQGLAQ